MVTAGLRLHERLPLLPLLPRTTSTSMRLASARRAARTIVGSVSPSAVKHKCDYFDCTGA